jgi:transcriptional regulator with XRE-family HTH domain
VRTKAAIKHYKTRAAIARALGISPAAVSKWEAVVPEGSAYKLESITGGVLRVDPKLYERRGSAAADCAA